MLRRKSTYGFFSNTSNRVWTVRFNPWICDRGPAVLCGLCVDERQVARVRTVAHLAKPNFPPSDALNEPVEIILDVLPSLVTWEGNGLPLVGSWRPAVHSPVDASLAKNGRICASTTSSAASTSVAPSCFWNPYAISLIVTGILRFANLTLAASTCSANCAGSRAQSYNGSDPNCKTRVTNLAFGLDSIDLKRLSRRVFHIFGSSQPNHISAWTPRPFSQAASTISSLRIECQSRKEAKYCQ